MHINIDTRSDTQIDTQKGEKYICVYISSHDFFIWKEMFLTLFKILEKFLWIGYICLFAMKLIDFNEYIMVLKFKCIALRIIYKKDIIIPLHYGPRVKSSEVYLNDTTVKSVCLKSTLKFM